MPLGKDMGAWIEDFQNSKNEKFAGKSKEERTKMAKAAYMAKYGKKKMEESDYGTVLSNNLMPGADVLKKYVDIIIKDPKIAAATTEQEFRGLLRDKVERAHFLGNKDEISKAAEYLLSLGRNAGKYSDAMSRVYNMTKNKLQEVKATHCGRCGHTHVKGTPCPRPFKEEIDLTEAKSFTIDTESATDSDKITDFLTSENIKFTKTGSKIKISLDRSTPKASVILSHLNRISKFEELNEGGDKPDFLDIDKDGDEEESMKKAAKDAKKGIEEARENDFVAKINPTHRLATKDPETWDDQDTKEYTELWDTYHGNDKIPTIKTSIGIKRKVIDDVLRKLEEVDINTPHHAPVTKTKHPIFEAKEYDYEGEMARTQLISIVKNAKSLFDSIGDNTQLQSWVQSKLTKAEDYLNAVRSYLDGESISNTAPLMINNEPAKDDEGTALSVGDVIRGADGKIYQAVHSYSEGKAFLTPFDLKKRKTTNLSQRHYFDAVAENEMSPTMKMYKVMPHTQTKGGFTK